ncbi:hypothetical protein [Nocardia abscessus]|uniref:hypothetical protein n=1 Tax=Nocardia abscessus TaxID=120957 RepID=UPI0024576B7C|nr:hypothetical protein [Nocardia abscessus]
MRVVCVQESSGEDSYSGDFPQFSIQGSHGQFYNLAEDLLVCCAPRLPRPASPAPHSRIATLTTDLALEYPDSGNGSAETTAHTTIVGNRCESTPEDPAHTGIDESR